MASEAITPLEVANLIRRRVMTPGEVFPPIGKYAGRVFYGRIIMREYKKKGSNVKHVTIKYDDGDCIWTQTSRTEREPSDGEEEDGPSLGTDKLTPMKDRSKAETAEDKAQRIEGTKRKEETSAGI
eukprot:gene24273-29482_t